MSTKIVAVLSFSLLIITASFGCATLSGRGGDFELPAYKEAQLKNGLKVLLIPDKSLPSLSFTMLINSGSHMDPAGKSGLANMVGNLLDKGTNERTALQIADSLGQIGAEFGISVGDDYAVASVSGLSFHKDKLLKDFSEIITQPTFTAAEVNRIRQKTLAEIKQLVDNPSGFASAMFESYLYKGHPYGQRVSGNSKSVRQLKRRDIIKFYLDYYRPNNAMLAVVGDFDQNTILSELEKSFSDWSAKDQEPFKFPAIPKVSGVEIQLVDKPDLQQTQIRIGHPAIKRQNDNYMPLRAATTALGGGFASRLMQEIRVKRGLTYGISSPIDPRLDRGPFVIATFTRHEKVNETVTETLRVLTEFHEQGIQKEELESAKALLKGQFPRALETAENLALNLLVLRFYKVPDSYLSEFLENVDELSVASVNKSVRQEIHPDNIKVLIYGPKRHVIEQLKTIGPVTVKSYEDFL